MLAGLIETNATQFGAREALVCGDDRLTHAELAERVLRLAGGFASVGVSPGDNVLVILPNIPEFVIGFFALARLGAAAVVMDTQSKEHELSNALRDCRPTAVITDRQGAGRCQALAGQLDMPLTVMTTDDTPSSAVSLHALLEQSDALTSALPAESDLLLYQYSSGSTGRPKRVGRTQGQCLAEAKLVSQTLGLTSDDTILCSIPLFHAYGFGDCMLTAIGSGGCLVLQQNTQPFRFRRERTLELIGEENVTVFPAVPFMIELLADAQSDADISGLRHCLSAGTALPTPVSEAFFNRFGVPARQLYGCTEAPSIAVNLDADPRPTAGSVGRAMAGVEIVIQDEHGEPVPAGTVGTVAVRSPAAADGYFGAGSDEAETFRAGWVYPGDLGVLDPEGGLSLAGRTKIFIDVVGHKVDPLEVEDVLEGHPAVQEAVVVGAGEPEVVKAAVVTSSPCSERELIHFCAERLAAYKVPRVVEFRESIPRSTLGKVLRKDLV